MGDVVNRFHMLNSLQSALKLIYMQITWSICMLNVICHTEALLLNRALLKPRSSSVEALTTQTLK